MVSSTAMTTSPLGQQHGEEMQQEPARHVAGTLTRVLARPAGPVEHLMVAAEVSLVRQPHDAQRLGDGTLAGCQNRTGDQHQDAVPDWCGEAGSEHRQPGNQDRRHHGGGANRFDALGCHLGLRIATARPRKSPSGMKRQASTSTIARDMAPWLCLLLAAMDDPIIQCVEQFRCPRGALFAERRNPLRDVKTGGATFFRD